MSVVYKEWRPRRDSLMLVALCNKLLEEELAGYRVTLRQLYYQLVARNVIPNSDKAYSMLSTTLTRARMAGLMDWGRIEDRVRRPQKHPQFSGLGELVEAAEASYRLDRWKGQDRYAELWVEKDALASVLRPLADEYHVTLMVNRGYSSASAMKEAADRFTEECDGRPGVIVYLGDLDPSGEDMVRDIDDRMQTFWADDVEVHKIALTPAQVEEYNPPPNPAKISDPRAHDYILRFGRSSWEVDALNPSVLVDVIRAEFDSIVDREAMDKIISRERADIARLRKAIKL